MGRIGELFGFRVSAESADPGRDKRVNIDRLMPAVFEVVWIGHAGMLPTAVPGKVVGQGSVVVKANTA